MVYLEVCSEFIMGQFVVVEVVLCCCECGQWGDMVCKVVIVFYQFVIIIMFGLFDIINMQVFVKVWKIVGELMSNWQFFVVEWCLVVLYVDYFVILVMVLYWLINQNSQIIGEYCFYVVN